MWSIDKTRLVDVVSPDSVTLGLNHIAYTNEVWNPSPELN